MHTQTHKHESITQPTTTTTNDQESTCRVQVPSVAPAAPLSCNAPLLPNEQELKYNLAQQIDSITHLVPCRDQSTRYHWDCFVLLLIDKYKAHLPTNKHTHGTTTYVPIRLPIESTIDVLVAGSSNDHAAIKPLHFVCQQNKTKQNNTCSLTRRQ